MLRGAEREAGTVQSQAGLSSGHQLHRHLGQRPGGGCSASYLQGTGVTLTATPASGNSFTAWSGDCVGSTCSLTMASNRAATAGFCAPLRSRSHVGSLGSAAVHTVVGMHLIQLPSGKGLMWGHTGEPQLWNGPGSGLSQRSRTTPAPIRRSVSCSAPGTPGWPTGELLVAGGHNEALGDLNGINQASIFDGTSWQATGSMTDPRWYPTLVTLANGEVLAISGSISPGVASTIPERYNGSTWTRLTGADVPIPAYARAFVEPKLGNVFMADGNVHHLDPNGAGSWAPGFAPIDPDRSYGPAVMLDSKVLYIGGGGKQPCPSNLPRKTVEIIDLAAPAPAWTYTGALAIGRRQSNATILPDGTVLVTGGTSLCGFSNQAGAVFAAELWNPVTGQWSTLGQRQRDAGLPLLHDVARRWPGVLDRRW